MSAKVNYRQIPGKLQDRAPFEGNTMRAITGAVIGTGELSTEYAKIYNARAQDNDVIYTVLSYRTPIAWITRDGQVVIPDTRYSVTTSRQQGLCRAWLDNR